MKKKFLLNIIVFLCGVSINVILEKLSRDYWLITIPIVIVIFTTVYEIWIDKAQEKQDITYLLQALYELIKNQTNANDFRITFHQYEGDKYKQMIDYVPVGGGKDRSFPINKGIVGKSLIDKSEKFENFESHTEYRDRMLDEYNYNSEEIGKKKDVRLSYYCVPIVSDGSNKVYGAIYMDSLTTGTFGSTNVDIIKDVKAIASVIESIVKK